MGILFMKREPLKYKFNFWCWLDIWHKWYYGSFIAPVYGRYERHCLNCPKMEFAKYVGNKRIWVPFDKEHPKGF